MVGLPCHDERAAFVWSSLGQRQDGRPQGWGSCTCSYRNGSFDGGTANRIAPGAPHLVPQPKVTIPEPLSPSRDLFPFRTSGCSCDDNSNLTVADSSSYMDWQNNSSAPLSSLYVMLQLAAIEEWQSQHANVQCPASGPKAKTAEIIGPSLAHEIRVSSESSAGCLGSSTNQSRTRVNRGSAARPATTSASVHVLRGNEIYPRTSVACRM